MSKMLFEAGHYYQAKGPTFWSELGIGIAKSHRGEFDKTLLFIDDVHTLSDVHVEEVHHPVISIEHHSFDYTILESAMIPVASQLVDILLNLPKSKRAKKNDDGQCFCSGFPITNKKGDPLCVLLDVALTKHKYDLGFRNICNVLPSFYEEEQEHTARILRKILSDDDFNLRTLYFEKNGETRLVEYRTKSIHSLLVT